VSDDAPNVTFIELVLVSHTNVGKTTLARTLLGQEIGEVRDAPHVTEVAEVHVLLRSPEGDELRLWDTPGFGDSARLVQRLRTSDNPIGWLLREVWDRYRDRPFWCSQQAVRAARASADAVLYLVNAAESPRDAGYLPPEAQVLRWLDKPVLVLLNQTGPPRPHADEEAEREGWRAQFAAHGIACEVLPLDAFARCWVQEGMLLEAVGRRLPVEKRGARKRLQAQWTNNQLARFEASMQALAGQLSAAASDAESIDESAESVGARVMVRLGMRRDDNARSRAMAALAGRVDSGVRSATAAMIAINGLEGEATETILKRVQETYASRDPVPEGRAALLGGVLTGALAGLKADLATGGLTMGAGALVGGLLGGLGGAGIARGLNKLTGVEQTRLYWPDEFLDGLLRAGVLRYLAIAHFGRGRGRFVEGEAPAFWFDAVQSLITERADTLHALWSRARDGGSPEATAREVAQALRVLTADALTRFYPADLPMDLQARMRRPCDARAAGGRSEVPIPA
jgi:hypothetical protein